MIKFKRFSLVLIAIILLISLLPIPRVEAVLYTDGPTIDVESIYVSPKEVGPNERVYISMKVTDTDPIKQVTVKYEPEWGFKRLIVLEYNETTNLYEGSLKIEEDFDTGEYFLYEIEAINSLNERTLIYGNYINDDRFLREDFCEHSFYVNNTNPLSVDIDSIQSSGFLQYEDQLDLTFKVNNTQHLRRNTIRVGYKGPKIENSKFDNIEYFDLVVDENGIAKSGNISQILTDKYELGKWELISILLPVESTNKVVSNEDFDLSAGDFILQEKVSRTPLIDLSSLQVEKKEYAAGETVTITVNPLPSTPILGGISIAYREPDIGETIQIGGYFDNTQGKYVLKYNTTAGTKPGEWIIDSITQTDINGFSTNLYNSLIYGSSHHNLSSGSFTILENSVPYVKYELYLEEPYGWSSSLYSGDSYQPTYFSPNYNEPLNIQGIKITTNQIEQLGVEYSLHLQSLGWQEWAKNGEVAGKPNEKLNAEAIKVRLTSAEAEKYDIYYQVFVKGQGWLDWAKNGEVAGSSGYALPIAAMNIRLQPKGSAAPGPTKQPHLPSSILYSTHVEDYGWMPFSKDGQLGGTTGKAKRLEGIILNLGKTPYEGGLNYRTHVQDYGWMNWVKEGQMSGTEGKAKRLEAIQIQLTGEIANHYDIYYRVHSETYGWLDWAKNGQQAGTSGLGKRLEAIEVRLIPKGEPAPGNTNNPYISKQPTVSYSTHIETYGWQQYRKNGKMSGTTGESKRLEAIKILLEDLPYTGGMQYKTHVEDYGWQNWVNNGQISGTFGQAKRLEAIQVQLTGEIAKYYDIYYRVHSEDYGWLDWAKNGQQAGTEGKAKRLEGIEIKLVRKGEPSPGKTTKPFIK